MKFEEVKDNANKRNGALLNLFHEFMQSDVELAELKEWEKDYQSIGSLYTAAKTVAKGYYNGKVRVSKNLNHVYIERIGKDGD